MLFVISHKDSNKHSSNEDPNNKFSSSRECLVIHSQHNIPETLWLNENQLDPKEHVIAVSESSEQLYIISQIRKHLSSEFRIFGINEHLNAFDRGLMIASGATDILPLKKLTTETSHFGTDI